MIRLFSDLVESAPSGEKAVIHALQSWQFLIGKAINRQTVRYEDLADLTGYADNRPLFNHGYNPSELNRINCWRCGMAILAASRIIEEVGAINVHFVGNILCISLSDGKEISVVIDQVEWLNWLAKAAPEQRIKWSIEPGGFAIYWDELDDGIEIRHLLRMQPIA